MKKFQKVAAIMALITILAVNNLYVYGAVKEQAIGSSYGSNQLSQNKKWYEDTKLIAHALGMVDRYSQTNSREAFLQSYEEGYRVLEADFSLTSDGTLVLRHDFEQDSYYTLEQVVKNGKTLMDINQFKQEKICFKYTPLTAWELIQLMNQYDDVYIVTDTKFTDRENITKQFTLLLNYARALGMEDVLDRFIVQIYNKEMLQTVKDIYPFKNFIFTLYQLNKRDYDDIAAFCAENGVEVATIDYTVLTPEIIKKFTSRGVRVYTHTVNSLLSVKNFLLNGVSGVYTDSVRPSDLVFIDQAKSYNTTQQIVIGNRQISIDCFMINNEPYYSIHDIAELVKNTDQKFSVTVQKDLGRIIVTKGQDYVSLGNELHHIASFIPAKKTQMNLYAGDNPTSIIGYEANGKYYYSLNDLSQAIGLKSAWNGKYAKQELVAKPEEKELIG